MFYIFFCCRIYFMAPLKALLGRVTATRLDCRSSERRDSFFFLTSSKDGTSEEGHRRPAPRSQFFSHKFLSLLFANAKAGGEVTVLGFVTHCC